MSKVSYREIKITALIAGVVMAAIVALHLAAGPNCRPRHFFATPDVPAATVWPGCLFR